jgi:hypothetical protein
MSSMGIDDKGNPVLCERIVKDVKGFLELNLWKESEHREIKSL